MRISAILEVSRGAVRECGTPVSAAAGGRGKRSEETLVQSVQSKQQAAKRKPQRRAFLEDPPDALRGRIAVIRGILREELRGGGFRGGRVAAVGRPHWIGFCALRASQNRLEQRNPRGARWGRRTFSTRYRELPSGAAMLHVTSVKVPPLSIEKRKSRPMICEVVSAADNHSCSARRFRPEHLERGSEVPPQIDRCTGLPGLPPQQSLTQDELPRQVLRAPHSDFFGAGAREGRVVLVLPVCRPVAGKRECSPALPIKTQSRLRAHRARLQARRIGVPWGAVRVVIACVLRSANMHIGK